MKVISGLCVGLSLAQILTNCLQLRTTLTHDRYVSGRGLNWLLRRVVFATTTIIFFENCRDRQLHQKEHNSYNTIQSKWNSE